MRIAKGAGPLERKLIEQWNELRRWVVDCGYQYGFLAKISGVNRMTLYKAQRRDWNPELRTVIGIARARDQIEKMEAAEKEKVNG